MKAVLLEQVKRSVELREISKPVSSKNLCILKLLFAGLNRRDYWIQQGLYPKINLPVVLGSDGLGIRESDGKRVFFNPGMNWGLDERFQQNGFHITGMPTQGTLAEYIAVPVTHVYEVPAFLSDSEGACLPLAGVTAYRGLFVQGKLERSQKVLITGVGGGVASIGLKMAVAMGAQVFTNSSSDDKLRKALAWGCEAGWNYKTNEDWVSQAKGLTGGFDFILDGAGGDTIQNYVDLLKPGGRLVAYGATLGAWKEVPTAKLFWKQVRLIGTTMGSDQDFEAMLEYVNRHQIRPHVDRVFGLADVNKAFEYLNSSEAFGKIVIKINDN